MQRLKRKLKKTVFMKKVIKEHKTESFYVYPVDKILIFCFYSVPSQKLIMFPLRLNLKKATKQNSTNCVYL